MGIIITVHHTSNLGLASVLSGLEACQSDAGSWNFPLARCHLCNHNPGHTEPLVVLWSRASVFQHLGLLGETEVMVEGLVLCDEKIAWDQDALCDSCLCPFLSRLGSGHYPFPWPHSHAQLFREHLGHWSRGRWEQDCCVTLGEAARKSSGSGTGLRSYQVLGSGAAHQSLVLTFLTVSQAPPKGKTWAGTPRGLWCESKPRQPMRALPVYRSYSNLLEYGSLVRVLESFPLAGISGTSPYCSIRLAVSRRLLLTLSLVVCNTHGSQFMELILPEPK